MGVLINTTLTSKSGLPIASGSVIKPKVTGGYDLLEHDENGEYTGNKTRRLIYQNDLYLSKVQFQKDPDHPIGEVEEFTTRWVRNVTDAEFAAFQADGSLAEQWLIDHLDGIFGAGTCSLVNLLEKTV